MPRKFRGSRTFPCEWCGKENTVKGDQYTNRFCNTSCSARWRMSQPEIKKKVHNPQVRAKAAQSKKGKKYPKISKWWIENNPMKNQSSRDKVRQTHLRMGHGFKERGGNGLGPTPPQAALHKILFAHGFDCEVIVQTFSARQNMIGETMPNHYKIDIGHEKLKIAVEVDGRSHKMPKRKEADARKDKVLDFLGWTVFRVTNERALAETKTVAQEILRLVDNLEV